jgi:uncharacterized protein (DUF488 family)
LDTDAGNLTIYTIGHSKHAWPAFLSLLRRSAISLVADARSRPYSRWSPQFNRETLARALEGAGLSYRFMGDALGGRPSDPSLSDPGQDHPNYGRMAQLPVYQSGIDLLLDLAAIERVAVMCAESDYRRCHRHWLIAQTLLERGVQVLHIGPDGTLVPGEPAPYQRGLLG